ncbi:MAG TPA: EAL domain-containing protein, partial [Gammaproteobacteria bacterium]
DLADAMSDGRLSMVFQPIVCLRSEPIELYEVFIRLVDRRGAVVPSRAVIAAARQKNLDIDLDLWVIERAIRIIESRAGQGRNTHLFINLSERCMDDIRIPLRISRELKARNVPARNLIIQLSEIAASGNLNKSHAFVESLHKIGCSTALDHFGLSLSAFQLLEDVSVEYLKLDESIVNRVAEDAEAYSQVAEICRRARKLEKQTIASYLDNPRSLSKLFDAGVDFVQGYYIHEPSDSMDFEFSILLES